MLDFIIKEVEVLAERVEGKAEMLAFAFMSFWLSVFLLESAVGKYSRGVGDKAVFMGDPTRELIGPSLRTVRRFSF